MSFRKLFLRVAFPDLNTERRFEFQLHTPIYVVKDMVLHSLERMPSDAQNYGLFWSGPVGQEGQFLQEELPLSAYPLPFPMTYVELRYKRRYFRTTLGLSSTKLKKLQSKANMRAFLEFVRNGDSENVEKLLNKGLDPNFHCKETGETPLSIAASKQKPRDIILLLVSGGGHVDFRSRDSLTPLHKAAICGNYDAISTFLELGQSPNPRDSKGLTPLYYTLLYDTNAACCDRLLAEKAVLGVTDENGLQEIHQATRNGLSHHLERLLHYGANLNAATHNGNTPLHICAILGNASLAHLLLLRGADRHRRNHLQMTAAETARQHRHNHVADLIQEFKDADVVRLPLNYGVHQTGITDAITSKISSGHGDLRSVSLDQLQHSSSPSNPPGNGLERSSVSMRMPTSPSSPFLNNSHEFQSTYSMSYPTPVSTVQHSNGAPPRPGPHAAVHIHSKPATSSVPGGHQSRATSKSVGHDAEDSLYSRLSALPSSHTVAPLARPSRDSSIGAKNLRGADVLYLLNRDVTNVPRTVVLQRGAKGFGFVLRGSVDTSRSDFQPTLEHPASQYFQEIEKGSAADKAELKEGDFVLEINGHPVITASHEEVVQLIKQAGDTLPMKVLTVDPARWRQTQPVDFLGDVYEEHQPPSSGRVAQVTTGILSSRGAMPSSSSLHFRTQRGESATASVATSGHNPKPTVMVASSHQNQIGTVPRFRVLTHTHSEPNALVRAAGNVVLLENQKYGTDESIPSANETSNMATVQTLGRRNGAPAPPIRSGSTVSSYMKQHEQGDRPTSVITLQQTQQKLMTDDNLISQLDTVSGSHISNDLLSRYGNDPLPDYTDSEEEDTAAGKQVDSSGETNVQNHHNSSEVNSVSNPLEMGSVSGVSFSFQAEQLRQQVLKQLELTKDSPSRAPETSQC